MQHVHRQQQRLIEALQPWRIGGPFLSFISALESSPDQLRSAYEPQTYQDLVQLKNDYDPKTSSVSTTTFHHRRKRTTGKCVGEPGGLSSRSPVCSCAATVAAGAWKLPCGAPRRGARRSVPRLALVRISLPEG
jgi:hypothetical protein